jgi:hypothetical protein
MGGERESEREKSGQFCEGTQASLLDKLKRRAKGEAQECVRGGFRREIAFAQLIELLQ